MLEHKCEIDLPKTINTDSSMNGKHCETFDVSTEKEANNILIISSGTKTTGIYNDGFCLNRFPGRPYHVFADNLVREIASGPHKANSFKK